MEASMVPEGAIYLQKPWSIEILFSQWQSYFNLEYRSESLTTLERKHCPFLAYLLSNAVRKPEFDSPLLADFSLLRSAETDPKRITIVEISARIFRQLSRNASVGGNLGKAQ